MPDDGAGIQLTVLGPTDSVDDGRLADFYTYPDALQSCWVRGNMIASLDGGATDDGKAGGLAGAGDRAVFSLMRHAADVILVGAATVRIENYSGAQLPVAARQERQRRGQAEVPPIAVVTQSGVLDPTALLFTRTEVPPLILTCRRSFEDTRRRLDSVAEVIDASGPQSDTVDGATVLKIFAERKRPARRAVPDDRADPCRRRRAAHRERSRSGAHQYAAHPRAYRRRRLPVHPLRQGRLRRQSVHWSACVGVVWSGSLAPRPSCCPLC